MLPESAVQQLTPIAAKVYLTLLVAGKAIVRAPLPDLARRAALSPRSCRRGIAQLRAVGILYRLPRRYHQPNAFVLVPEYLKIKGPPQSPHTPAHGPAQTPHPAAAATPTAATPPQPRIPAPKNPDRPAQAPLLNSVAKPPAPDSPGPKEAPEPPPLGHSAALPSNARSV